jgi:hypothetical protein
MRKIGVCVVWSAGSFDYGAAPERPETKPVEQQLEFSGSTSQTPAEKLRRSHLLIAKTAELFGVSASDIVKVSKPGGKEVPMRLDEVLNRLGEPKTKERN